MTLNYFEKKISLFYKYFLNKHGSEIPLIWKKRISWIGNFIYNDVMRLARTIAYLWLIYTVLIPKKGYENTIVLLMALILIHLRFSKKERKEVYKE